MEVESGQEERYDTDEDNPLMYTQKVETLEPFSSHVIPSKDSRGVFGRMHINVMVQALHVHRMAPCCQASLCRIHTPN